LQEDRQEMTISTNQSGEGFRKNLELFTLLIALIYGGKKTKNIPALDFCWLKKACDGP